MIGGTRNEAVEDGFLEQPEDFQPVYEDVIFQTVPGTMLTYDWETNAVLAPQIARDEFGPALWSVLARADNVDNSLAGIFLEGDRDSVEIPVGAPNVRALVRGFGPGGAATIDKGKQKPSEN